MGEWERQRPGEGVVWKNEKVNKWEVPSYTHACKSTNPPSIILIALGIHKATAFPRGGLRGRSVLFPKLKSQTQLSRGASADNPLHFY